VVRNGALLEMVVRLVDRDNERCVFRAGSRGTRATFLDHRRCRLRSIVRVSGGDRHAGRQQAAMDQEASAREEEWPLI
jgi:type II secretory pathway component PulJ